MILFFYGEDSYRSHQKLTELKAKYIDSNLGDTNLTTIDVGSSSKEKLTAQLLAYPFLAKSRLVIIPDLLAKGKAEPQEAFLSLLEKIPDTTVAVVYEAGVPDRRTKLFKALVKKAKVAEFKPLEGKQLEAWIAELLLPYEAKITLPAVKILVANTNGDSWRIASELKKLGTMLLDVPVEKRVVDEGLVRSEVAGAANLNVFELVDATSSGNQGEALKRLRTLLDQGENEQYLLAMIASALRNLLFIRDALERGQTNQREIAGSTKMNPFVVGKNSAAARATTIAKVDQQLIDLADLDLATKTGKIDASLGLELFLLGQLNLRQKFLLS